MENDFDITQCPVCKKTNLKRVLTHIDRNKSCKSSLSKNVLDAIKEKSSQITLKNKRELMKEKRNKEEYKRNERKMMREKRSNEDFRKRENEKQKEKRSNEDFKKKRNKFLKEKRSNEDFKKSNENSRRKENARKNKINDKKRTENYVENKEKAKMSKRVSRKKQRDKNEPKFLENNRNLLRNARMNSTADQRLKAFLQGTMHNAIFICTCCHVRCFQSNVIQFTNVIQDKISSKNPSILQKCIPKEQILSKFQTQHSHEKWSDSFRDEEKKKMGKKYICNTCLKYLKNNKMPPSCVKNGLEIHETNEYLKAEDLILTDLEGALIARSILFMKIFQLPTSRWTGMVDKAINVPIPESSVLNTIEKLPRTPTDAGLISVNLKRKKEYNKSHISQLINPQRIYNMLEKLKNSKNPHYKFYEDFSTYKERCIQNDPKGSKLLYTDSIEENLENPKMNNENFELLDELMENGDFDSDIDDENEIQNQLNNDPTQKYNFNYDKNLCLTDKYPEISVAPGEGQTPKDISMENDWDVKAFPHIHNLNGSNGLSQEREVRLSDQKYFIQRICNKNTKYSKCQPYIYAAVCSIERKQLQRNMNLAGTRGKKTMNPGGVSYELKDSYRVLEGIKNTPKYWKTAKYEIIAKIENFGAFQFFFTLSCADMRWTSNFAPLLLDMGYKLNYTIETNKHGTWKIKITGRKDKEEWRDIMDIIKDFDDSQHEILRQNVLTATRYFNHRVRQFISKILLCAYNPMNVKFYSYKVEFQQRGAGNYFYIINLSKFHIQIMFCPSFMHRNLLILMLLTDS